MTCDQELNTQSYLDGELQGAAAAGAERHLQSCATCQALAAATADLSDALRGASRYRALSGIESERPHFAGAAHNRELDGQGLLSRPHPSSS